MDDLKLSGKNDGDCLNSFPVDIGKEIGLEKCAKMTLKKAK